MVAGRRGRRVGLFVVWAAWTAWSTQPTTSARSSASALLLRQEIEQGDADGAARALERYQEAPPATRRTRPTGRPGGSSSTLPVFGDDAEAVATAAEVLDELGDDGIPQLVDAAELVAARSFNPSATASSRSRPIASVGEPARESERAFDEAATELEASRRRRPGRSGLRPASPSCASIVARRPVRTRLAPIAPPT